MNVTLIGPGRHGTVIAALPARHGADVTLCHHKPGKAEAAAARVRAAAQRSAATSTCCEAAGAA